ncbi:phage tail tape measure protein, partial [Enterobacter hormaechei]|nr:phage tail tape measure protein [Enterobacter hormaechei]
IVDKVVASNPAYNKLEEKLKTAPENERKDIINSPAKILEGSGIGKIIADQQALLALLGYRGNKTCTQDVISEANSQRNLSTGKTAGDLNFSLMSEQPRFKLGQLDNERDFQEMDSVKPLSDSLGYLSDKLLKYAEE